MNLTKNSSILEHYCGKYNLHFVDCTVLLSSHSYFYIGSHQDPMYYIEKIAPDQLEVMSPEQIESFVLQCALTDITSYHGGDDR